MKKLVFILLVALALLCWLAPGCKNRGKAMAYTNDSVRFYPVNQYILQQIKLADSGALYMYQITTENGKSDTAAVNKSQFNALAKTFLQYDINSKALHKYYKESIFLDENTRSYTFSYTAMDTSLPLKTVNVLLDVKTTAVKWIFITIVKKDGINSITEKAGWKNNERFFINRITLNNTGATVNQNTIVWRNLP